MFDNAQIAAYHRDGYFVAKHLFSSGETDRYRRHFMALRAAGSYPGDFDGVDLTSNDPLKRFPRMINMHRWDPLSLRWLLDDRLRKALTCLLGIEPFAAQSMLYFKPPGSRGQALHQDQFYVRAFPGTCMAAWLALDDTDEENGCMQIVSHTSDLPLLCPKEADKRTSFTNVTVPVPESKRTDPIIMHAGDVLFFNGSVIHGSFPNRTADRFRRALIGHYVTGNVQRVAKAFHPLLRFDGSAVDVDESPGGAPCGEWVVRDGYEEVVNSGFAVASRDTDGPRVLADQPHGELS